MSETERCDGSSECQAAEHIEGCFATTKRHAQRSWAERYAGPTLEQQLAGAVDALREIAKADPIDNALDPQRPVRIAKAWLREHDAAGGR